MSQIDQREKTLVFCANQEFEKWGFSLMAH